MIKLPRTGYPVPKYQFGSQVVLSVSELSNRIMKLLETGNSVPNYQFGSCVRTVCIKNMKNDENY